MYLITKFYNYQSNEEDRVHYRFLDCTYDNGSLWSPYLKHAKKFLRYRGALRCLTELSTIRDPEERGPAIIRLSLSKALLIFILDLIKINGSKHKNLKIFACTGELQSLLMQDDVVG